MKMNCLVNNLCELFPPLRILRKEGMKRAGWLMLKYVTTTENPVHGSPGL
jgi:hypothetical protein